MTYSKFQTEKLQAILERAKNLAIIRGVPLGAAIQEAFQQASAEDAAVDAARQHEPAEQKEQRIEEYHLWRRAIRCANNIAKAEGISVTAALPRGANMALELERA
jgi:hypothetical protein